MRASGPVADRRSHGWLRPDELITKPPAITLQRKRDTPRNTEKLLVPPGVAEVQPEGAVVAEHAAHLAEDFDEALHVFLDGRLVADAAHAIVAEAEVGRARDARLEAPRRERRQHVAAVARVQ